MAKKRETTTVSRAIKILNAAYGDVEEIVNFIALEKQQPLTAIIDKKVAHTIWQTIDKIAENPFVFKECEEIHTETKIYRRAVCLAWLIIYKITAKEILILGIIQGSRNLRM